MKNTLLAFALIVTLFTSACASAPGDNTETVRFNLRPEQIVSWEEKGDGVAVSLNDEGKRQLSSLTRHHKGSEMQIYAGRIMLTSVTIDRVLRGDNLYVAIDNDGVHGLALSMLPPAKNRARISAPAASVPPSSGQIDPVGVLLPMPPSLG